MIIEHMYSERSKGYYEYDEKGNLIELTYLINGNIENQYHYQYDENGNMVERTYYDDTVDKQYCETITYNPNGIRKRAELHAIYKDYYQRLKDTLYVTEYDENGS